MENDAVLRRGRWHVPQMSANAWEMTATSMAKNWLAIQPDSVFVGFSVHADNPIRGFHSVIWIENVSIPIGAMVKRYRDLQRFAASPPADATSGKYDMIVAADFKTICTNVSWSQGMATRQFEFAELRVDEELGHYLRLKLDAFQAIFAALSANGIERVGNQWLCYA